MNYLTIEPSDVIRLRNTNHNIATFPKIEYADQPLIRSSTTIRAMRTNIINAGFGDYIKEVGEEWSDSGDINWQNTFLNSLYGYILSLILKWWQEQENDELLVRIFILIQFWGGNTGRNIFVRGGGFNKNFHIKHYKKAIHNLDNPSLAVGHINGIKNFGTSFATKHLHFWSAGTNNQYPIFDSVISRLMYGRNVTQNKNRYIQFYHEMHAYASEKGVTCNVIERSLFNWADTPQGQEWIRNRAN